MAFRSYWHRDVSWKEVTLWQTGKLTIGMESGSFEDIFPYIIYPIEDEDKLHGRMLVFPEGIVYMYKWLASRL